MDPEELEYWDEQLVQSGAAVTFRRSQALGRLSVFARRQHGEVGEPEQNLTLGISAQRTTRGVRRGYGVRVPSGVATKLGA